MRSSSCFYRVEDLQAAFEFMQSRQHGKTVIFGSSMGGTVALLFAAQNADDTNVAAVVTLAAPGHPENFPKRVLTPKQLQRWRNAATPPTIASV